MKTKEILLELIELLESFEEVVGDSNMMTLESFLSYAVSMRKSEQELEEDVNPNATDEAYIARMLSLIYRYARGYTKKALQVSPCLQSEEEYTYLLCLMNGEAMSKGELHLRNGLERTTGSEMLRRLQKHGLIEEEIDPVDKRQRLVRITPQGRAELAKIFPNLKLVAQIISAPLDERQKMFLKGVLVQLHKEHSKVVLSQKDETLQELLTLLKR